MRRPPSKCQPGDRYGRPVLMERVRSEKDRNPRWLCKCDCGETTIAVQNNVVVGKHRSCGCLKREMCAARMTAWAAEHGPALSTLHRAEYMSWTSMRARCLNPNATSYPDYGGRGITICERWRDSFENFLADMGPRPSGTSIDRKDVNGDYTAANCRWATDKEQGSNRRQPKPRKVDTELRDRIIALADSGLMYIEIAPLIGISKSRVGQIVRVARGGKP